MERDFVRTVNNSILRSLIHIHKNILYTTHWDTQSESLTFGVVGVEGMPHTLLLIHPPLLLIHVLWKRASQRSLHRLNDGVKALAYGELINHI